MKLSAIICTHNPREEHLRRTLDSISSQNLPHESWELLVIDNASNVQLANELDLGWHTNARVIREDQLGLTSARLRGIKESVTEVICFIDDDNELAADYFSEVLRIADTMPHIGCWGGEIHGEYETEPPEWFAPYQGLLVVRPLQRDTWGNTYRYDDSSPCGAGLCVRRKVVDAFLAKCEKSKLRLSLDRRGQSLASAGDTDLAYTAIDLGYGTGRFKCMQMTHLIPTGRIQENYLLRLYEAMAESEVYLNSLREETLSKVPVLPKWRNEIVARLRALKFTPNDRRMFHARRRGHRKGLKNLKQSRDSLR